MTHPASRAIGQRAASRRRIEQARQHSAAGHSLEETAAALGLKPTGLQGLLFRELGTKRWPLSTTEG